jgi:type I restriction enzyme, S subunit
VSEMPQGWIRTSLGEVVESMKNGIYKPASSYADDGVVCLRMYNIDQGKVVLRDLKRMRLSKEEVQEYGLRPGDLLVNRVNSRELVGKTAMIPAALGTAVFESKNIRVRLNGVVAAPEFVSLQLLTGGSRYFANNAQQVVGMASISQTQIADFPVVLPPRSEQNRIVAKLDELLSDLDAGIVALQRARANLKRYRAAVLMAAVKGRLTEKWRAAHPDVEPASMLLERILTERRKKWEAAQIKKYADKGQSPPMGWQEKYPEPVRPEVASLPALPPGWCWANTDQLFGYVTSGSRGWAKYCGVEGDLFLGMGNLDHDSLGIDLGKARRVRPPEGAEGQRTQVNADDILISITADVGMVGLVPNGLGVAYINQHLALARCVLPSTARYVAWYLTSNGGQDRLKGRQRGATKVGLGLDDIQSVPVPIPPLAELTEVVAGIEDVQSVIAHAEDDLDRWTTQSSSLRQSILKRAFEGKLVPQDPKDEPASALLARIRAGKEVGKGLIGQDNGLIKIRKKIRTQ